MVNNQEWFNKEYSYSKELKEIEIKYEKFQGQLVIEDYPELERLYLRSIKSIDKIILKNLPQLQECAIRDSGMKELIIENCPQIKRLNVRKNNLTSLEFLKGLDKLEELEIDGNAELVEVLNHHSGDWKTYQKDLWELIELSKTPQQLMRQFQDLKEENKRLKIRVKKLEEEKSMNSYLTLQEKTKQKEKELDIAIEECKQKMGNDKSSFSSLESLWNNNNYTERLEELLKEQEMASKYNDGYLVQKKEELVRMAPKEFFDELKAICKLKDELIKLEAQINNNRSIIINQGIWVENNDGNLSITDNSIEVQQGNLNIQGDSYESSITNKNTLNYANFITEDRENTMKSISQRTLYEKLKEIFNVVFPNTPLNFDTLISLEERVKELKNESLDLQLKIRSAELEKLIAGTKVKIGKELEFFLNSLLEVQANIIKIGNDSFIQKHLQDIKNVLNNNLSEDEIDKICQLKKEITQLEQVTKLTGSFEKEKLITSSNDLEVKKNDEIETKESFQEAQIEVVPKNS